MPVAAAVIGAGTAIYAANRQKKAQSEATKAAEKAMGAADPYAQYRAGSASQLNAMSQNGYSPNFDGINQGLAGLQNANNSIGSSGTNKSDLYGPVRFDAPTVSAGGDVGSLGSYSAQYKDAILAAREQSAQRQSAAQGYTGSGNALVAAANAGTEAIMYSYQLGEQDRQAAERTRQLQFDASYANAGFGLQNNQLYAQQLMSANGNLIDIGNQGVQKAGLGIQGATTYLNAMYQNQAMLQDAYNNRFNQLAMLSGAEDGINAAAGISGAVSTGIQNQGQGSANQANAIGSGIAGVIGAFGK